VPDQVNLLKRRGMIITDENKAAEALHRIGYYRLSGYWHPMRQRQAQTTASRPLFLDNFQQQAVFADVIQLYVFDKRLRLLMLDAIERVEVGLRVEMALLLSQRSPWAHRDPSQLDSRFVGGRTGPTHAEWLQRLDETARKSKEKFVQHFQSKYVDPLPMWMAIELWDFGSLSIFLSGMKTQDLSILANHFSVPRRDLLTSWARSINGVRNICAHHGRLWNRVLVDIPSPPKLGEIPELDHWALHKPGQNRLYAAAAALRFLLRRINPSSTWPQRLAAHLATFPASPHYRLSQTGFPADWDRLPFWA
jgi:abortive infection bacteriophage resistance protein